MHTPQATLCPGGKERMRRLMSVIQSGRVDLGPMVTASSWMKMTVKAQRQIGSERLLGWQRGPLQRKRSFSEPPVLLHAGQVRLLTQHLESLHQMPWRTVLARNVPMWTEYTLYYGFLAMRGVLNRFCDVSGVIPSCIWKNPPDSHVHATASHDPML